MGGLRRGFLQAGPAFAVLAISIADLLLPRGDVVFGLLAITPLLATCLAIGTVGTAVYGGLAVLAAGMLGLFWDRVYDPHHLPAQVTRLVTIAATTVLAVILCRVRQRYERQLVRMVRVAETAQRAILLQVPDRLGPARVAVHYESAANDALVGGDLYGMMLTPYGLRVLVGDVRGKGLEAVRTTAQVLAAFRERAGDHPDLAVLMDQLDRGVARRATGEEDFVTAVLVQIADDGTATIANAGHPSPYLVHDGQIDLVVPGSPRTPLGLGGVTRVSTLSLTVGDRLLLYTDGLTEARDPVHHSFLPTPIITSALTTGTGVVDAIASLRDATLQWTGGALHDDIALLLVEYRPQEAATLAPDRDRPPCSAERSPPGRRRS